MKIKIKPWFQGISEKVVLKKFALNPLTLNLNKLFNKLYVNCKQEKGEGKNAHAAFPASLPFLLLDNIWCV